MSLIHNERTKLTATCLNSIAAAAVAVGGIIPTIAATSGVISFGPAAPLAVLAAGGFVYRFTARQDRHEAARRGR